MQIVIDIPNFAWIEDIKDFKSAVKEYKMGTGFDHAIREALLLGTPLPEHHGRLIDADALEEYIQVDADEWDKYALSYVKDATTIIEADKLPDNELENPFNDSRFGG